MRLIFVLIYVRVLKLHRKLQSILLLLQQACLVGAKQAFFHMIMVFENIYQEIRKAGLSEVNPHSLPETVST